MQELFEKKITWVVLFVAALAVNNFVVIKKASERAVQQVQKPYSPSPYGPGFDPDKVHESFFKSK